VPFFALDKNFWKLMFNNLMVMWALTIHALGYPMGRLASALANFKVLATKHPTLSQSWLISKFWQPSIPRLVRAFNPVLVVNPI
jgi:hypothetical protein